MSRGKGSERKQRHCGYNRPHTAHVYSGDKTKEQSEGGARKYWCPGRAEATAEAAHKHVWESDRDMPVMRGEDGKPYILFSPYDENPTWEGPLSCSCGKSKLLKDGRYKPKEAVRFPRADALERIMALKEKLDAGGPEALDEEDKAELEAIAADIIRTLQPLMEQLQKFADVIVKMIQSFLDSLSPETMAYLVALGKSIGEKPVSVDTIELRDSMTGEVIATQLITPEPVHAASLNTGLVALPSNVVHIEPGQAIVGGQGVSLDGIALLRAQSFRSTSEY